MERDNDLTPFDDLTPEQIERYERTRGLKSSATANTYVDIPRELWNDAVERAHRQGDTDRPTPEIVPRDNEAVLLPDE